MYKRVYQILTENNIMHNLHFGFGLHDLQFFLLIIPKQILMKILDRLLMKDTLD